MFTIDRNRRSPSTGTSVHDRLELVFTIRRNAQDAHRVFWRLSREIGLRRPGDRTGPRVHDFRHRFAIRTLLIWYREGKNVEQQLPVLSTYLGHACVRDTYWYLSACPELMEEAARRLDRRWEATP